ncbi:Clr6 histone deacetylase associated PHD protein-2 Cph2 [Saxophila tyrrhenica]|uniref:Clr6 histone deacetylase associated PHD protein-2 Cph2 n=1 Tax=Saxophila tyrrhenica TaxID=1690608 RepID=A0AAV9PD31_9PEZI|nr:Clr6 histone deacetylase associated PHD protein-2 Cph2 [Saxophila tyrrhenica]
MDQGGWQGGFPIQHDTFGQELFHPQSHEDWEDWLRWDSNADTNTSPEDTSFNSGSSKNDSPLQDSVMPADLGLFGKGSETLAPPMVMGEDTFDFGAVDVGGNEPFLFGAGNDGTASMDFQPVMDMEQPSSGMPKLDTNAAGWALPLADDGQNFDLSALTAETWNGLPSAGTAPSTAPSLHHSPGSSDHARTSISSNSPDAPPPPKKRGGRKRKAEVQLAKDQDEESSEKDADGNPIKKTSHNVIEKRYRNNLNDKIVELRNSVPSLRAVGKANRGENNEADLEGLTPAHKLNKATVMGKATEYIKHLEKRNKTIVDEMATLKARLAALEATMGKNRDRQASLSMSPQSMNGRSREMSSSSQNGAAFLNVPQEQNGFGQQVVRQQYMQQQAQPNYNRPPNPPVDAQNQPQYVNGRGGGVMSKVMLGTMAGLMVMEGYSEQDNSGSRSLGAFPVPGLFKRGLDTEISPSSAAAFSRQAAVPLLKMVLVIGALAYILAPLLSLSPRRKQKSRSISVRLPHAPSLASPIEVRRKAWLTAIQTVWVPKHFLLEVVAVTAKMISLSVRRLVGTDAYNSLTGANKEDETARIKAWDIAIDAQLAGGDQEVSYYRLLLTLMESGTLPDSPTRLMQKAVHFRVFFWEVANAGYGNMVCFKQFTEKVGRFYWDTARRQQKELLQAKAQGRPFEGADDDVEVLPDHLASLLELDCDEVLSDEMIQRAWNLAWNKPSAYRTVSNMARDVVIEDHAIRSPLDAVAAWYANMTVDDTLIDSVAPTTSFLDTEYYIALAVSIAPPASATLARALAAKAVLSNSNRVANTLAALDSLPSLPSTSNEMNLVSHIPATPDIRTALTLAKLHTLLLPGASATSQTRALDAIATLHLPPASFTLLTAIATTRLLTSLTNTKALLPLHAKHGLEDLAANLRIWVGTSAGRAAGLGRRECARVVEGCLAVAKKVGGWGFEGGGRDSGYGSSRCSSVEGSPVREVVGTGGIGMGI